MLQTWKKQTRIVQGLNLVQPFSQLLKTRSNDHNGDNEDEKDDKLVQKDITRSVLPDPTARMPDWGGLMMAQNCLIPKGPPKFDTVNVPPCKESKPSIQHPTMRQ
jgi:hypothetical protein